MAEYNREKVHDAKLEGISKTKAAQIAGELDCSTIKKIQLQKENDRNEYRVTLEVSGGFFAFGHGECRYAIRSISGNGKPETVTIHVVEKVV